MIATEAQSCQQVVISTYSFVISTYSFVISTYSIVISTAGRDLLNSIRTPGRFLPAVEMTVTGEVNPPCRD